MGEVWKDVIGWEEFYVVSNTGRVKSKDRLVNRCDRNRNNWVKKTKRGRILMGYIDAAGYFRVDLINSHTRERKNSLVHRLVAIAFLDNQENKPQVNHIDGVKINNDVSNLEWCTPRENFIHAIKNGLTKCFTGTEKGEKCPSSKLSNNDVIQIKKRLKNGETPSIIAKDFPVTLGAISEINAGRSWSHIVV